jgi:hypothetical protein
MNKSQIIQAEDTEIQDQQWKDLYRIGGIFSILAVILTIVAISVFLIWPFFLPGQTSTEKIFTTLQNDLFGGLITLDLFALIGGLFYILPWLALYISLKQVNNSYALIALVLGLIGLTIIIPTKPITEVVFLSEQYTAAKKEASRSQYLAAGEALLTLYTGTAWIIFNIFLNISGLIYSFLILRNNVFNKATAYVGIIGYTLGFCIFIPVIGIPLAGLATLGIVVWFILVSQGLLRLGWSQLNNSKALK